MNAAAITVAPPPVTGEPSGSAPDSDAVAAFAGLLTAALEGGEGVEPAALPVATDLIVDPTTQTLGAPAESVVSGEDEAPVEATATDEVMAVLPLTVAPSEPVDADPVAAGDGVDDAEETVPASEPALDHVPVTTDRTDGAAFRARLQSRPATESGAPVAATPRDASATATSATATVVAEPSVADSAGTNPALGPAPAAEGAASDVAGLDATLDRALAATDPTAIATSDTPEGVAATPSAPVEAAPVANTDRTAATGTVRQGLPTPPANQLASAVAAMRRHGDGEYTASLDLHPAELGRVQVEVEIRAGVVNVHVNAEQSATRSLLAAQLDDLRAALSQGGLDAGQLDVSQQGWSDRPADREESREDGQEPSTATEPSDTRDPVRPTTVLVPDSGLDVRL